MPREIPIQDRVWLQRDGTPIRLGDMLDSHIANCIRMLKRQWWKWEAELAACCTYPGNPDGMGAYYAEVSGEEAGRHMGRLSETIEVFMTELRRRHPDVRIHICSDDERLPRLRL